MYICFSSIRCGRDNKRVSSVRIYIRKSTLVENKHEKAEEKLNRKKVYPQSSYDQHTYSCAYTYTLVFPAVIIKFLRGRRSLETVHPDVYDRAAIVANVQKAPPSNF